MNQSPILNSRTKVLPLLLLSLPLIFSACGRSSPEPVYPVKGELFVNGKPAVGAEILFHPVPPDQEKVRFPNATVKEDGSFVLTTYRAKDGAPPGDYKVTILWRDAKVVERETIYGPDKLKNLYSDPVKTILKATVETENNELPRFDLKVGE